MVDRTGNDLQMLIAGNAFRRTEMLGNRHFRRRSEGGGHSSVAWLVVSAVALTSFLLGIV